MADSWLMKLCRRRHKNIAAVALAAALKHKVRSSKYMNNLIEQNHRHIKSRTNMMLGFKRFRSAATTISDIELMHRIRRGQFDLAKLGLKHTAALAVWNAALSDR